MIRIHDSFSIIIRNATLAFFVILLPRSYYCPQLLMAKCPDDCSLRGARQHVSLQSNQRLPSARPVSDTPAFKLPGHVPSLDVITPELFQ